MKSKLLFIIVTYIVSIFFLIMTLEIPSGDEVSSLTSPDSWPLILIISILVLNSFLLIRVFINRNKEEVEKEEEDENNTGTAYKSYLLLGLVVVYVLLLQYLGFIISTIIFFPLCGILIGMRNKTTIIIYTMVSSFAIYGLFAYLLNVPLP